MYIYVISFVKTNLKPDNQLAIIPPSFFGHICFIIVLSMRTPHICQQTLLLLSWTA